MKKNEFLAKLKDLQTNTALSSSQIFINLLELIRQFSQTKNSNKILDENVVVETINILEQFHPEMAIMDTIKERIHSLKRPWNSVDLDTALDDIKQRNSRLEAKVIQKVITIIKDNGIKQILTVSYSRLVFNTINDLYKENLITSCTICDSGPRFEGLLLVKDIHNTCPNLNLNIISDAMAPGWVLNNQIDAAIFGADTVYSDNSILNKTGSLGIWLSSAFKKINCYVIATSFKRRKTLFQQNQQINHLPSEYSWYKKQKFIEYASYWNHYFDYVPKSLIKLIIDDE